MDCDVLGDQRKERFEEEFAKALDALERAPDGHCIDAGEMAFRDAALPSCWRIRRSASKRASLRLLRAYITERFDMLDCRRASAYGWDIRSGPTEAMCKNLTLRLKRTGMKWPPDNAAALMNLAALRESGQWNQWRDRFAA